MNLFKEELRVTFAGCAPPQTSAGKIAERLRRLPEYRKAKTILMMPSSLLFQARINCLLDGKVLLMPSPALKLGFYRVKPFSIAFPDLAYGTSLKGITLFGKKMQVKKLRQVEIDLALTGCVAIDQTGHRLGEGTGFFDLSMGILGTLGAVSESTVVGCVAGVEQQSENMLICDPWDVGIDFLVMKDQDATFATSGHKYTVDWDVLEKKQLRKIEPLWHLYCELNPEPKNDLEIADSPKQVPSPWAKSLNKKS